MAITKRIRFEVLRRDGNACRYCGAKAGAVELVVDHVVPKALGGTDEVTNLCAACEPCNSGKTSVSLDSPIVADVKAEALRYSILRQGAYQAAVDLLETHQDYLDAFTASFGLEPPTGWEDTLKRFCVMGVPIELVTDAAVTATRKPGFMNRFERFKYFCGIVWNQVRAVDAVTAEKVAIAGHFYTAEALDDLRIHCHDAGVRWALSLPKLEEPDTRLRADGSLDLSDLCTDDADIQAYAVEKRYTEYDLNHARLVAYEEGMVDGKASYRYRVAQLEEAVMRHDEMCTYA
jgi:HNH endonuclease